MFSVVVESPIRASLGRGAVVIVMVWLAALVAIWPAPAHAADTVGAIEVVGNRRIDGETVRFHLGLQPGDHFDAAKSNAALKALFATGQFADVRINLNGATLRVEVVENPVVGKVAFDGAKDLDEKMVKAAADLKPKEPWTRAKGEAALQRIRTLYRTKGHEDASIELTTGERPDGHVDVTFKIDETAIVKVERIGFTGNRAFTEAQQDCFDHVGSATYADLLAAAYPVGTGPGLLDILAAIYANPQSARGLWRQQAEYARSHPTQD